MHYGGGVLTAHRTVASGGAGPCRFFPTEFLTHPIMAQFQVPRFFFFSFLSFVCITFTVYTRIAFFINVYFCFFFYLTT